MKLNNFWTRIISGIGLIAVTVTLFWLGSWGLALFSALVAVLGMSEFFALTGVSDKRIIRLSLIDTGLITLLHPIKLTDWGPYVLVVLMSFIVGLLAFLWKTKHESFKDIARAHAYLTVPLSLLQINSFDAGGHYNYLLPLFLMVLVWSSDSWAYVSGKLFGKHKLAPSISPGKTWEGLIGGSILTAATAYFFAYYLLSTPSPTGVGLWFHSTWTPYYSILLGLLVSVFGTLGDLFASSLKRAAGVKDSGNLIPGHGGILDRFDAFIFAIFIMNILG